MANKGRKVPTDSGTDRVPRDSERVPQRIQPDDVHLNTEEL